MSNSSKRKAPKRDQKADRARTANNELEGAGKKAEKQKTAGVEHYTVAEALKASKRQ